MHLNILNSNQQKLFPLLAKFNKEFYMVGGTAIAIHIGHRFSIDFDLFKVGNIKHKSILKKFEEQKEEVNIIFKDDNQLHLSCRGVKFTFFDFEFEVPHPITVQNFITIPSLLDLAAMKAYALGRRSKWKDYADLFFILKNYYSLIEISKRAEEIFGDLFNEKLFRGQLSYFNGISFEEQIEYLPGFETEESVIKDFLTEAALTGF